MINLTSYKWCTLWKYFKICTILGVFINRICCGLRRVCARIKSMIHCCIYFRDLICFRCQCNEYAITSPLPQNALKYIDREKLVKKSHWKLSITWNRWNVYLNYNALLLIQISLPFECQIELWVDWNLYTPFKTTRRRHMHWTYM